MKLLIVVCFYLFALYSQAQCTFEDVFPFEHGMSKFKVTTIIESQPNIKEDKEANRKISRNGWDKMDYLNGDSVYRTYVSYDYINHPCFNGRENNLNVRFADDWLYQIAIKLIFTNTEFDKCMQTYNKLVELFRNHLSGWWETTHTTRDSNSTEQVGEGVSFTPELDYNVWDELKTQSLRIGYEIKYERIWDEQQLKNIYTGNVEEYIISIDYINLYGTKMTIEGY